MSLAPKVTTADAEVNWKLAAPAIDRLIRACTPAPGAWTLLDETRIKLGPVDRRAAGGHGEARHAERPRRADRRPQRGAGRHRHRARPARRRPGARQAADDRRRVGARPAAAVRPGTGARLGGQSSRRPAPAAASARGSRCQRPAASAPRPVRRTAPAAAQRRPRPPAGRIPPAAPPMTCCAPSPSAMPTPTCCCRQITRPARPHRARRRAGHRAQLRHPARPRHATTPCSRSAATATWPALDPAVREMLRLGTHQLLATRIAAHAAVATSVDLVRDDGRAAAGRLRQRHPAPRRRPGTWRPGWRSPRRPAPMTSSAHLAVRYSHPRLDRRGPGRRPSASGCQPRRQSWPPDRGRAGRGQRAARRAPCAPCPAWPSPASWPRPAPRPPAGRRSAPTWPTATRPRIPAVADGRAGVQDEASQLAAIALTRVAPAGGCRQRWLDLCAGPGGKARLLAGLAARAGARLRGRRPARAPCAPGPVGRAAVGQPARRGGHRGRRHHGRPGGPARSTGSSPTSPAPASARCGAAPRRAGGARPDSIGELAGLQRRLLTTALDCAAPRRRRGLRHLLTAPGRDQRGRRRRARRAADVEVLDAPAVLAEVPGPGLPRPGRPLRAVLAAPARHRRDLHRPAPARLARPGSRRPWSASGRPAAAARRRGVPMSAAALRVPAP